jgi:hypothetical protein
MAPGHVRMRGGSYACQLVPLAGLSQLESHVEIRVDLVSFHCRASPK